jgi:uncharacterized protein YndB with AHSA1/START domain
VSEEQGEVVRIERNYDATAEEVFDAWTNPEVIKRWFIPGDGWQEPSAEVELRVGGRFSVVMRDPEGQPIEAGGEFTLVERPHRLAYTWTFEDDPSNEQLIELEFTERDGVTTVVFVNSNISEKRRRDQQYDGWSRCFDELERALRS